MKLYDLLFLLQIFHAIFTIKTKIIVAQSRPSVVGCAVPDLHLCFSEPIDNEVIHLTTSDLEPLTTVTIQSVPVHRITSSMSAPFTQAVDLVPHPAQGHTLLACLCSLGTTRGQASAQTGFLAPVMLGQSPPLLSCDSPKDAK